MAELSKEAGFPDGVINVVTGFGAVGAALSSRSTVRKISFTGSDVTGRAISVAAAKSKLKHVSLELGGKGAVIVG